MDMSSMSMSMAADATATMPTMSMATASTSSPSDMAGTMKMDSMDMVFFTSTSTPLWSSAFMPNTAGQYAGTCIFLTVFATIFRFLLALRVNFFEITAAAKQRRNGGLIEPYTTEAKSRVRPWRAREAVVIAALDVVIAGVGYLLMVAVMTMNLGYFLSILGGVFLGSMVCGRFTGHSAAH